MAFVRPPRGAHGRFAAPIEAGGERREHRLASIKAHLPGAGEIQTHFHATRMKTSSPIKFLVRLEIVPLETRARRAETAVQMLPAWADRMPRGAFRKPIACGGIGRTVVVRASA